MSKLILNDNTSGAEITIDESNILKAYTVSSVTNVEYLHDSYKRVAKVSEALASVVAASKVLIPVTLTSGTVIYINKDRARNIYNESSTARIIYDGGGAGLERIVSSDVANDIQIAIIAKNGDLSYAIDSFTAAPKVVVLDTAIGDVEANFPIGRVFTVFGEDDANDNIYTTVSAAWDGTNTKITVAETTTLNAAATGYVWLEVEDSSSATSYSPGTTGTDVTAVHYSADGKHFVTKLTLTDVSYTIAGAANEAVGALIYTFPAGVHSHKVTNMNVALQGGGTVDADTPNIGIGSVIGTGAVATLGGTTTFKDYITGQLATDCSGTATVEMSFATAGYGEGISLNQAGDVKAVHLNIADLWAGADTVLATGTVTLEWTII